MDLLAIKDSILGFLSAGAVGWLLYEIRMVRLSVENLNIKVALVVEKMGYHEREIERHHYRLERLEDDSN